MKLLDSELLAKIKGIQLKAKHLVNSSFAGEYKSAFRGRGMEFDELRNYTPGDDIRSIDWNVTARMGHPFVKIFKDERELTVLFLVDVSGSHQFGTKHKFKNEVAAEITAMLAYLALRNNDKVGLIIFSDEIEHYIPPKKGRGHVWSLIRDILTFEAKSTKTNLAKTLDFLNKVSKSKTIVFLISDFYSASAQKELRTTANHHELIALMINDPREFVLPKIGFIELEDAETQESIIINTNDKKFRDEFHKSATTHQKEMKNFFQSAAIDFIPIQTDQNYVDPIVKYFRSR